MHPNSIFRRNSIDLDIAALKARAFGALVVSGDDFPIVSHIPFILEGDDTLLGHIVRNTPMAKAIQDRAKAMMIVTLGDSYISPDWYGVDDQVPTWNYVAIHVTGRVVLLPHEGLDSTLAAQSKELEARLAPKKPWHSEKMNPGVYQRMQRSIVPFRMEISDIQSTWKLNQNKEPEAIEGAAHAVKESGFGLNTDWIANEMLAAKEAKDSS
ncbi:MAG: FMN-binding negative transcriptional regulator [Pseudomonadota bacterium]